MNEKILVVDDEKPIVDILKYNLSKEGYNVLTAYDGDEAIEIALKEDPDLILLDIMLPKQDGFSVCKKLREKLTSPILMLTARGEEVDKVLGLELGADDYITKPFSMRELMARVKANLRRMAFSEPDEDAEVIKQGDLELDLKSYVVRKNGKPLDLTFREFELLRYLAAQPGQVFTREKLLEEVWGYEYYGDIRTVDVTVRRLREKVEDDPANPEYIITKRGIGYYFKKQ
ncbi:DNA-binding response regulator [Tepidanaerobacter syntrophicus]|uniref:Stage 0 sporulation protein A homolog n=1 Tax=Tepidanaerobacter syntrophicus TaxID=224999 RepID=A0A0U9HDL9_9FIRM|nr:response regulator YycF [Tepidanaerobacter syntrophicus]GAQ24901.1 two-component system, OmpR family, response regulator VicR [Tepidanaerobacter syntrophicus]GLI18831.1 DNA-binding response regulator [Tepidanaerobacter syntrophicus]GLI51308.1 DNA-binding response regulator [Tepidanaerobacter syntrophicus]HHV82211.1 response regulator transcription factor [Tepidanaerobacter syntrophicus]